MKFKQPLLEGSKERILRKSQGEDEVQTATFGRLWGVVPTQIIGVGHERMQPKQLLLDGSTERTLRNQRGWVWKGEAQTAIVGRLWGLRKIIGVGRGRVKF